MRNLILKYINAVVHEMRNVLPPTNTDADYAKLKQVFASLDVVESSHSSLSWASYLTRLRDHIMNDNINDFLNWEVIKKTMNFEAPYNEFMALKADKTMMPFLSEDKVGNPKPYYAYRASSGNLIHHAYSILQLKKLIALSEIKSIFEIGGGYGSMRRLFSRLGFSGEYSIFDFSEFLALQQYYLSKVLDPFIQTNYISRSNQIKPSENGLLLIATWSLSEMPIALREEILSRIQPDFVLIAYQNSFDGINNKIYFSSFETRFSHLKFVTHKIQHLPGNYYLIGRKEH
ncbi:putative sugar O-methyltransferase [Candidatus Methylopumilus universalis]|nr:putative sugar O-methyltransferase [Candidatus Methylopumilus universalis]